MARIEITPDLFIDESEIDESFILASGPGGQNVNKVASAVQLRFNAAHSPSLSEEVRQRLMRLAGNRLAKSGEIVLVSRRTRSQERNRADARERLIALLRKAATPEIPRKRTRPPRASRKKRLENKIVRGQLKRLRARPREN
jgi:ribosome-associated protein